MSTTGTATVTDRPTVVPHLWRRVTEYAWWSSIAWVAWFWLGSFVVWIGVVAMTVRYDELGDSIWIGVGLGWTRWILFAAGVALACQLLPLVIAQGGTRRAGGRGCVAALALLAAAGAAVVLVVHLIEGVVFHLADATRLLPQQRHLFDSPGQWYLVALEAFLTYLAFAAGGWLTGTAYYRFGPYLGTLWLPLGLVPIAVVELLVSGSVVPEHLADWRSDLPTVVEVLGCLFAVGVILALTEQVQQRLSMRPRPR